MNVRPDRPANQPFLPIARDFVRVVRGSPDPALFLDLGSRRLDDKAQRRKELKMMVRSAVSIFLRYLCEVARLAVGLR